MKTNRILFIAPSIISIFAAGTAFADENPCGKFDFSAGASCEIKVKGGCETECTPVHFEAACRGVCDVSADATCNVDCKAQCLTECDPGSIDCTGYCRGDCYGRCDSECSESDCAAQCEASCNSECAVSCTAKPPSCETSCTKSCDASCKVEANINCDVDCYADLEGGCKTQCEDPSGALFCNGQYVGTSEIDACITYIRDTLNGEVNVEARGEVTCELGKGCDSVGSVNGKACSVGSVGAAAGGTGALAAIGLALGAAIRRRRRSA